ncbi:multiple C2 and transmembrane domain-containing protein isoform X2 [Hermetia illucens]|uniref:multiple C2 and transmembrane domain-containing protein isoform X2 n=1 Tax=Hermetia illucens TaxID=343691 RepID=UPI0018CC1C25|nr:multiple C2 and transmembrane domain-containing protein isoform X2 [Hermetia illucens]
MLRRKKIPKDDQNSDNLSRDGSQGSDDDTSALSLLGRGSIRDSHAKKRFKRLVKNVILGSVAWRVILMGKNAKKSPHFQRSSKVGESSKRLKSQIWSSVVTILLVEGKNMTNEADGSPIYEPYIKFRLGNEKYKSKTSYRARWLEQFDFHLFDEDQILEVGLWSKNSVLGRCTIDLSKLPRETTHAIWQQFEDHHGEVFINLTISGTTALETISDLTAYRENPKELEAIRSRYKLIRTVQKLRDVGHLTVKVYGASGLAAADIGGKSDPFCVLELDNARLQTQTEYKTLTPNWNKIFTFNIKDITSALEITVYDEDRDHKVEFLGKVIIPLLRIRSGVKHWYALKDKKLFNRAKGNNPQILLEMTVVYNPIRAAVRVFQPKEERLVYQEPKFKRQVFLHNVNRLKDMIMDIINVGRYINGCLEWESPVRSIIALCIWVCCCLWAGLEIIPVAIVLVILKNWFVRWITGSAYSYLDDHYDEVSDDDEDENQEIEQKKSIKERLQAIQEVSQTVQNTIGNIASLAERIKNTLNFTVPGITWLVALLTLLAAFGLRYLPIRGLLIAWGCWKFTKRLIRPNAIPNNELLDILSRVPDDDHMIMYRELPPYMGIETSKRDTRKKFKIT